jgi:hypothetical protein
MLDHLLRNSWHIHWLPREYVFVSRKEVDEREFLFVIQLGTDECCLRCIAVLQLDGLHTDVAGVGLHHRLSQLLLWRYSWNHHLRQGDLLRGCENFR